MSFGNVIYPQALFFQGGLITVTNGSATVTGTVNVIDGTATVFLSAALEGDTISISSTRHYIKQIVSDSQIILTEPWTGPSASNSAYTGARSPWHLNDRALAYKFAKFLEGDASASATARQAADEAIAARADTILARDLSQAWASRAVGQDVTTSGTRSALHWSSTASTHATAAAASAVGAAGSVTAAANAVSAGITDITAIKTAALSETTAIKNDASAQRQLAADWAEKALDTDVTTPGTRSAKHHATKAAASEANVATNAATAVAAKDDTEAARSLAEEWAQKPYGQAVTGTADSYSSKHWAAESAASAAAAAALVHAAVNTIDYGFIPDLPTDFADYGTLP